MKYLTAFLLCAAVMASPALGKEVWRDGGFALETAGWKTPESANGWSGLLLGLTVPSDGMLMMYDEGALELYIPGKGWVKDVGVFVLIGCIFAPDSVLDTSQGPITVLPEMACAKEGDRVLMIARIPRVQGTRSNLPTQARWVPRKAMHYEETP